MANNLDEMDDNILEEGREARVIAKKIPVEQDASIQVLIWVLYLLGASLIALGIIVKFYYIIPVGIILPILVYSRLKKEESYFMKLEQRIQQAASSIDNYLEQRLRVLQNTAAIVEKAVELDKSVFAELAKLRGGVGERNEMQEHLEALSQGIKVAVENYPDLKSHQELRDAMQQNLYLQREITAARELYNDAIGVWNREIFEWPFRKYVAAKNGYTTRIPFIASKAVKEQANGVFF